ncbi:MAG: DctP family TRAP transporter solute-binding subunit [Spirochaetaceae bacterium]|nr:DctP family TRAP transporter solute-binding subunit [Spirochaetaceae bacterium]
MENIKMKKAFIIALCMGLSFTLVGCNKTSESKTVTQTATSETTTPEKLVIRVSNGSSKGAPAVVEQLNTFKPMVEEASHGRIQIDVYSSAQLGDDTKATEACRQGELEIVSTSTAPLVGLIPELAIFDIPFLFKNGEQADAVLDGPIGDQLNVLLAEKGLINLAWNENGFRDLTNSVRNVYTPDDLKGLKIRTMENKYHLEAWKLLGASPTPMSWAEVFTALQQGTIDGQENPIPNFYSAHIQEVNKFITRTNHVYSPLMLLCSKQVFDSYDAETQQILRDAAKVYAQAERKLNREQTIILKNKLVEEGCTVIDLTPEQRQLFVDKTLPVWASVEKVAGSDIINQLKAAIK